jgi:hypothetical protein
MRVALPLLLALAAVVPAGGTAAQAPDTLELRPRWQVGQRQVLAVVRTREHSREGQTARSSTRVEVTLVVRQAGRDGSVVEWSFAEPRVDDSDPARAEIAREMAALTSGLRYVLEVDADGDIKRLRNWEQVRALSRAGVARLLDRMRGSGTPEQVVKAVAAQVTGMFASEEQIRLHGLREASLYHAAYGRRYRLGTPVDYADVLPSPLGGPPIPSKGRFLLARYEAGAAVIDWRQEVDPEAARAAVFRTLSDMAVRMGRPGPREDELPDVSVQDSVQFRVDPASGWVRSVSSRRISRSGPATRVDELTVTETGR